MSCEAGCGRIRCGGMLHEFIHLMLRVAERKGFWQSNAESGPPTDGQQAEGCFVPSSRGPSHRGPVVSDHLRVGGGRAMHRLLNGPDAKPDPQETDGQDEKVVRFVPRRRPEPDRRPDPPETNDDDDDPGPPPAA